MDIGDLDRRLREREEAVRNREIRVEEREQRTHIPITVDDPTRSWRPGDKCPDFAMNALLDVIIELREFSQDELSRTLADKLDVPLGTARAYVSGGLLGLREAEWVTPLTEPGDRHPRWRIV